MANVELLYFPGCPNVDAARSQLMQAFTRIGASPRWTEIDITAPSAPERVRGFGSPTVLIDGQDVAGDNAKHGAACRIYLSSEVKGAPSVDDIVSALKSSAEQTQAAAHRFGWLLAVPSVLFSSLPVLSCPSCWPAYAGVLSALGVPYLMSSAWLLPLTVAALLVAVLNLGFRAQHRRGLAPLALGICAASFILVGKFWLKTDWITYVGTVLLVAATLWNAWPRKRRTPSCETCSK